MFGVYADFDGLVIAPSVPAAWDTYRLRKKYQGIQFNFTFENKSGKSKVSKVLVNGSEIELSTLCKLYVREYRKSGKVNVKVIM